MDSELDLQWLWGFAASAGSLRADESSELCSSGNNLPWSRSSVEKNELNVFYLIHFGGMFEWIKKIKSTKNPFYELIVSHSVLLGAGVFLRNGPDPCQAACLTSVPCLLRARHFSEHFISLYP